MTEGMRSSEFWVTISVLVAIVALAALGKDDLATSLIGIGLAVGGGGYALARGITKGGTGGKGGAF